MLIFRGNKRVRRPEDGWFIPPPVLGRKDPQEDEHVIIALKRKDSKAWGVCPGITINSMENSSWFPNTLYH